MAASSQPQSGVGIYLSVKVPPATTYTQLVQVKDDMDFDGFDTTVIPIPTLLSKTVAKTPGRTDYGSLGGSMYLVNADAGVAQMVSLAQSGQVVNWQVTLNDGSSPTTNSTYQFSGFVSNIKPGNFSGDDAPTQDFTIAISGAVLETTGS